MKHTNTICAALGLFIGITTGMQEAHTTLSLQENTLRNHNEHVRLIPLKNS